MPLWSHEELEECRASCYSELIEKEVVEALFNMWGGVARYTLVPDKKSSELALAGALASLTFQDAMGMIRAAGSHGFLDLKSGTASHRLLHIKTDATFTTTLGRFCSQYVCNKLVERIDKNMEPTVLGFLQASINHQCFAASRGYILETFSHRTLSAGGRFLMRKLTADGGEPAEEVTIDPLETQNITTIQDASFQKYAIPYSSKFTAVDAIARWEPNCPGTLYQITVSMDHKAALSVITKYREALVAFEMTHRQPATRVAAAMEEANMEPVKLVYVVSEDIFERFPFQPYRKKNRVVPDASQSKSETVAVCEGVEQYVLCIPVSTARITGNPVSATGGQVA